jgi:hypothetical protein
MKIGLIDVDGRHFPNLALMKISAYHKKRGDLVEWVNYWDRYDKVYCSKVFTFTPDVLTHIQADEVVKGGTGYNKFDELFCDSAVPDYSLYPIYPDAYGFLTRGCIRQCSWCIVPYKEGGMRPYCDIETVLQGRKRAILLDNNVLASDFGLWQIEKIVKLKCRVDFNQGLDARLVSDDVAKMLAQVKWIRFIRFALDTESQTDAILSAIEKLNRHGVKNRKVFVYVLLRDLHDSYRRINLLKQLGVIPFAQPFMRFDGKSSIPQWQLDMAHYTNRIPILKSVDFKDFRPRRGFKCVEYFKNERINHNCKQIN